MPARWRDPTAIAVSLKVPEGRAAEFLSAGAGIHSAIISNTRPASAKASSRIGMSA
jgi:hypothetical protein